MAKILICDDSILARSQMRDMLTSIDNYEVIEAKDGKEAVDVYKEQNPDLVFLDIVMPEKNGIDVVTEIVGFDKDAKIIMASSLGNNKNLKAALEGGAIDFIQKPVDEERLRDILNKNLGGR